jgi:hypothetical protein
MDIQGGSALRLAREEDYQALLGALEELRMRLLDLTARNRLLNFRHTTDRSLQFIEGRPGAIYEMLVEGSARASVTISGVPEPTRQDWIGATGGHHGPIR